MVEDLNETHLKRPFDTKKKTCLFHIYNSLESKVSKGRGKGERERRAQRGKP